MNKEEFTKVINTYQHFLKRIDEIGECLSGRKYGINMWEWDIFSDVDKLLDIILEITLTEAGEDLVYWWLFEDVDKIIYQDDKEDVDVDSVESLYDFMVSENNIYFK